MNPRRGTVTLLLAILLIADGVVVAAFTRAGGARADAQTNADTPRTQDAPAETGTADDAPRDDGWALCQTRFDGADVMPSTAAITYLDGGLDSGLRPEQVRAWFGAIPGGAVDVYALSHKDGSRRVALEIARGKWSGWDAARGQDGEAACGRVRAALLAAGIGRPRQNTDPADPRTASRHDFEFIYARRAKLYDLVQWLGTLDDVLEPARFEQIMRWLEAGATPSARSGESDDDR